MTPLGASLQGGTHVSTYYFIAPRLRRGLLALLALALILAALTACGSTAPTNSARQALATLTPRATATPALPTLAVRGNRLVNALTGGPVTLVGASHSSLEYSCQGDGHYGDADFQAMKTWGMNAIRVPLSSQLWANYAGTCPTYVRTVTDLVTTAQRAGFYVVLTLQWDAPFGDSASPGGGQYPLPDATKDAQFWVEVATRFGGASNVLFDLFSEPHNVTIDQWFNGGSIVINSANDLHGGGTLLVHGAYQAIGMRDLAAQVRHIAANVILLSGLDWGYGLGEMTQPRYAFATSNLVYSTHPWQYGSKMPTYWNQSFGNTQRALPVIAAEFGQYDCDSTYIAQAISYFNARQMSWFAWTWNVGPCRANSDLLADWSGAPNSPYSAYLRAQMLSLNATRFA